MPEQTLTSKLEFDNIEPLDTDIRDTMVSVDNVSIVFNMASEQMNNLKEYFISLLRGQLFFEAFKALDGVSFEVKRGDVFGILGTNGSGKSTVLKTIAGVLDPTEGSVTVNGSIAPLIELGAGFDMDLSARENIYLNGALLGYSKQFIDQHFDEIVEFAEVEQFLDMPMKNYSSGMVARIAFAIATAVIPDVLIVDEVLAVGDFMFQRKCEDRINDLITKHGVTVLIVSHSTDQIARMCNRAVWIEKGHVRIMGNAAEVCDAYRVLGGRSGAAESESAVYKELMFTKHNRAKLDVQRSYTRTIGGEDDFILGTNIAAELTAEGPAKRALFIPCTSHIFSVVASGLAGALDAALVPYDVTNKPTAIVNAVKQLHPEEVYVLGDGNELGFAALLKAHGLELPVYAYYGNGSIRDISTNALAFGLENNLFEKGTLFAASFDDSLASLALSSLAYSMKAPFLVLTNNVADDLEAAKPYLNQLNINRVIVVGKAAEGAVFEQIKGLYPDAAAETVTAREGRSLFMSVFDFVSDQIGASCDTLCVATGDDSKWSSLLSCAPYAACHNAALLLLDPHDLDSTATCVGMIKEAKPSKMTFLGESGLQPIERDILIAASISDDEDEAAVATNEDEE